MKKTIAKIMAAAMVLSAVPAVAVPSLTAEAAAPTTVTISGIDTSKTLELNADGSTDIKIQKASSDTGNVTETFKAWGSVNKADAGNTSGGYTITGGAKDYVSKVEINSSGYVVVSLNDADDALMKMIKDSTNVIGIKATLDAGVTTANDSNGKALTSPVDLGNFYVGGVATDLTSTNYTATDGDGLLVAGEIGVNLTTGGEAEIVKGNTDVSNNDNLRGATLNLDEVQVAGISYPVTKVGAQALKEAHMKKLSIQNTKKVGKGALRKAKQMTKVDISDANKVRKIHSKAFYGDKNLKTVLIDGRKLNTVGSQAFSGVKKNCTIKIKAKKSKYNSDVKLIKKSGAKNVKFTRVAP